MWYMYYQGKPAQYHTTHDLPSFSPMSKAINSDDGKNTIYLERKY